MGTRLLVYRASYSSEFCLPAASVMCTRECASMFVCRACVRGRELQEDHPADARATL